jgi:outer membrane protein assembly factor BamB
MRSPYYEAAFALNLATGAPVWHYQPRLRDAEDMDFGSTPNVYTIAYNGIRDVVGFGSKDGTYTLIDAKAGQVLWKDKLTAGGNFGGFYNTVTDGARIYLTSAIGAASGTSVSAKDEAAKGRVWAVDAATGNVDWVQDVGGPTLGQNAVIPGVYFASGLDHSIHVYNSATGAPLAVLTVGGADSSGPAIVGSQLFTGAGTGATFRSAVGTCLDPTGISGCGPQEEAPAPIPIGEYGQGIWAFCLASDPSCQTGRATG